MFSQQIIWETWLFELGSISVIVYVQWTRGIKKVT